MGAEPVGTRVACELRADLQAEGSAEEEPEGGSRRHATQAPRPQSLGVRCRDTASTAQRRSVTMLGEDLPGNVAGAMS